MIGALWVKSIIIVQQKKMVLFHSSAEHVKMIISNRFVSHLTLGEVSCQRAVTSAKVFCQLAGRRPRSLLPASYWNTNKEIAFK